MLKNKFFISLLMCAIVTMLKALDDRFDNALHNAEQIARQLALDVKNHQDSLFDIKNKTRSLISQLRTLPNYLQHDGDTLFIEIGYPTTSGIIIWENKISKQAFLDDINNIEKLYKQATNKEQFSNIINLLNKIFAYFNSNIN